MECFCYSLDNVALVPVSLKKLLQSFWYHGSCDSWVGLFSMRGLWPLAPWVGVLVHVAASLGVAPLIFGMIGVTVAGWGLFVLGGWIPGVVVRGIKGSIIVVVVCAKCTEFQVLSDLISFT